MLIRNLNRPIAKLPQRRNAPDYSGMGSVGGNSFSRDASGRAPAKNIENYGVALDNLEGYGKRNLPKHVKNVARNFTGDAFDRAGEYLGNTKLGQKIGADNVSFITKGVGDVASHYAGKAAKNLAKKGISELGKHIKPDSILRSVAGWFGFDEGGPVPGRSMNISLNPPKDMQTLSSNDVMKTPRAFGKRPSGMPMPIDPRLSFEDQQKERVWRDWKEKQKPNKMCGVGMGNDVNDFNKINLRNKARSENYQNLKNKVRADPNYRSPNNFLAYAEGGNVEALTLPMGGGEQSPLDSNPPKRPMMRRGFSFEEIKKHLDQHRRNPPRTPGICGNAAWMQSPAGEKWKTAFKQKYPQSQTFKNGGHVRTNPKFEASPAGSKTEAFLKHFS